jgi:two-component system sensor histidine kinase RegB
MDLPFSSPVNDDDPAGLDRPPEPERQAIASIWRLGAARRLGPRIRTLVNVRWLAVAGQLATILVIAYGLGFPMPTLACLGLVALSAALNLAILLAGGIQRQATDREATAQLAFDILQLSALLYLTGGTVNPFSLLLIAPVVLAAATLPLRHVISLGLLAVVCVVVLSISALPLPSPHTEPFDPPLVNRIGNMLSRILGIIFCAGYAWQAASEAARMELALDTTNAVLAREQRLSALGALAAAAAHELGTPLATITIVAGELARDLPEGLAREDAELLVSQSARCREILQRLTADPRAVDEVHRAMGLAQLLEEAIAPHVRDTHVQVEAVISGPPDQASPEIRRMPEVLHALTSFVENAVDFATSEVLVTARFDDRHIALEIRDDGPGFAPEVLAKLGEPYVTSRPAAEGSRSGHTGLGLGFFIAKTLMERTGAVVSHRNGRSRGAVVMARWPRDRLAVET